MITLKPLLLASILFLIASFSLASIARPNNADGSWRIVVVSNLAHAESKIFIASLDEHLRDALRKTDMRITSAIIVMEQGQGIDQVIGQALYKKPDLLLVLAATLAESAHRQAPHVPVIFKTVLDPALTGLVSSSTRPGNNMTGFSKHSAINEKKWELLVQAAPNMKRIGVLLDSNARMKLSVRDLNIRLGQVKVILLDWEYGQGLPRLAKMIKDQGIDALDVGLGVIKPGDAHELIEMTNKIKIPTMFHTRWFVENGGLLSHEGVELNLVKTFSAFVLEILHGASASELPIRYPTAFTTSINTNTAKLIGVTPSPGFLKRIDSWYPD